MRARPALAVSVAVLALTALGACTRSAPSLRSRADGLLEADAPPGTIVRYTLDGSEPDRGAGAWLAPVDLPPGYALKARAFSADGDPASSVAVRQLPPAGARRPSTLVPVTQNRDWHIYDWAARHAACVALMKSRRPEVVMLGDSITHFWGGDPDGEGVAGRRTGIEEWNRFFAGRRVVNLGYDEIVAGITGICAILHSKSPATRILLLGIFPRGPSPDATRAKVDAVNERIAKLNGHDGVTYLDIGHVFLEPDGSISKDVMYDFLHPSALGYSRWAAAMKPTLDLLMAQ